MKWIFVMLALTLTSCSMKTWYPTLGAVVGGGAGSIAGPVGGAFGAGSGALVGEVLQGNADVEEAKETIEALSHGDVQALVEKGMAQHQSTFDEFASYIKNILIVAACILGVYLSIPIFVARKTAETCSKSEAEKLTRPPFPPSDEKS